MTVDDITFSPVAQPDTEILVGPAAVSRSADASFVFIGNQPDTGFDCSLDGARRRCPAGRRSRLRAGVGAHTFTRRRCAIASGRPTRRPRCGRGRSICRRRPRCRLRRARRATATACRTRATTARRPRTRRRPTRTATASATRARSRPPGDARRRSRASASIVDGAQRRRLRQAAGVRAALVQAGGADRGLRAAEGRRVAADRHASSTRARAASRSPRRSTGAGSARRPTPVGDARGGHLPDPPAARQRRARGRRSRPTSCCRARRAPRRRACAPSSSGPIKGRGRNTVRGADGDGRQGPLPDRRRGRDQHRRATPRGPPQDRCDGTRTDVGKGQRRGAGPRDRQDRSRSRAGRSYLVKAKLFSAKLSRQ